MRVTLTFLLVLFWGAHSMTSFADKPQIVAGTLERIDTFPSNIIPSRFIDVWLPPNYNPSAKYAVLYMHDAHMLWDASNTWNGQAWEVDDVASQLISSGKTIPFIVVGIPNGNMFTPQRRHNELLPAKPWQSLNHEQQQQLLRERREHGDLVFKIETIESDNYLRFIVEELKPYIDSHYPVYTDKAHTFIMGSSMGGLISIYAISEYPQVFGGAACMSTHWPGLYRLEDNPIPQALFNYLEHSLPDTNSVKIYFDYGDQTLDALYPSLQRQVDTIMANKGWNKEHWITLFHPGDGHDEVAWHNRLHQPLQFLLGVPKSD